MNQSVEIVDLGFSVADAEDIKFHFDGEHLILEFIDWQEQPISVKFENTIGYKYQLAEYWLSDEERFDSTHRVKDSEWVKIHLEQGEAWDAQKWYHYKINFNAGGIVEILCTDVKNITK